MSTSPIMKGISGFKGALIGVLMGDCLGACFEGAEKVSNAHLNKYFAQLHSINTKVPWKPFTDDTAMTKSVALSLITCKRFDPKDMAVRFCQEYAKEPKRGYGASIGDVFVAMRLSQFEDPFGPAQRQFQGMGSYGNGAAMRVTPVALVAHSNLPKLEELAIAQAKLTHANKLGYQGALFQALAVREALHVETEDFDVMAFVDRLRKLVDHFEQKEPADAFETLDTSKYLTYAGKLETVKEFLAKPEPPELEEIHERLGVHVSAPRSVPTALYCFLVAQKPLPDIETDNKFQRCIQYAMSLGGDTDTIASMAGAMAGAHLGINAIPQTLFRHCEDVEGVLKWAEDLHALAEAEEAADAQSASN